VDGAISGVVPVLLGLALIGLSVVAYRRISPTVGGEFFERHQNLKTFQRLFAPVAMAVVGVGVVIAALVH
jgi:hypothetical protein